MQSRFVWFTAGAVSTGTVLAVAWFAFGPHATIQPRAASTDFYNAFAIHGPLETDWSRVHQVGDLDVWSDTEGSALAITQNGEAVQMITVDDGCCTFEIFDAGEYKATLKYGNYDDRLMSQGADPSGTIWTYVDMGINGTIDFRFIDGINDSSQQVIMTQYAGDEVQSTKLADHNRDSGW